MAGNWATETDRPKFQSCFCEPVTFLNLLDFSLLIHYILYPYIPIPSNIYLVVMFWRLNRTNNIKYSKLWLNSHTINKINTFLFHSNQRNFCYLKTAIVATTSKKVSISASRLWIWIWSQDGMSTGVLNVAENYLQRSQLWKKQWPINTDTMIWNLCNEVDQTH